MVIGKTSEPQLGHVLEFIEAPKELMGAAGSLYDARDAVRTLHPEETELLKELQSGIVGLAERAGSTSHMSNHSVTFGNGWSRVLDSSIATVEKAMDVIAGGTNE